MEWIVGVAVVRTEIWFLYGYDVTAFDGWLSE